MYFGPWYLEYIRIDVQHITEWLGRVTYMKQCSLISVMYIVDPLIIASLHIAE